jgi:hypothetical protein
MAKRINWKNEPRVTPNTAKNERLLRFLVDLTVENDLRVEFALCNVVAPTKAQKETREAIFEAYGLSKQDRGALRGGQRGTIIPRLWENTQTMDGFGKTASARKAVSTRTGRSKRTKRA